MLSQIRNSQTSNNISEANNVDIALMSIAWQIVLASVPKHSGGEIAISRKELRNYYTNEFLKVHKALRNEDPLSDEE